MSMRIRNAKVELIEAGESTEGMVESTARLQERIMALTGVDIMLDESTFKSTYQVMDELAQKWEHLTDIQRASVIELMAGRHHGNTFSALMNNFQQARNATETALNSEGSAWREQQHYMKGIQYSLDRMRATYQEFAQVSIGSDFIKGAVDGAQTFLELLTKIIDKVGMLPIVLTGIGVGKGIGSLAGSGLTNALDKTMSRYGISVIGEGDSLANAEPKYISRKELQDIISSKKKLNTQKTIGAKLSAKYTAGLAKMKAGMVRVKTAAVKLALGLKAIATAMIPMAAIAGAVMIVNALRNAWINYQTTASRSFDNMSSALEKYQSSKAEVEALNSELETTRARIDELNAKPSLTIVEQAELNSLNRTNEQLERQLAIKERIAEIDRANAISSVNASLSASFSPFDMGRTAKEAGLSNSLIDDSIIGSRYRLARLAEKGWMPRPKDIEGAAVFDDIVNRYANRGSQLHDIVDSAIEELEIAEQRLTQAYEDFDNELIDEATLNRFITARNEIELEFGMWSGKLANLISSLVDEHGNLIDEIDSTLLRNSEDAMNRAAKVGKTAEEVLVANLDSFFNSHSTRHLGELLKQFGEEFDDKDLLLEAILRLNIDFEAHGLSVEDIIRYIDEYNEALESVDTNDFIDFLNNTSREALQSNADGNGFERRAKSMMEYAEAIQELNLTENDFRLALDTDNHIPGSHLVKVLAEEAEAAGVSVDELIISLRSLGVISSNPRNAVNNIFEGVEESSKGVKEAIQGTANAMSALNNQSAGRSLSFDTFTSLQGIYGDIHTAVEYVNGSMQLNRERTLELVKAKNEETLAHNKNQKAIAQSNYIRKAQQIQRLNRELKRHDKSAIEHTETLNRINELRKDQSGIKAEITGYNLLISSMDEATNAYHNWLGVKGQPMGMREMLSETTNAFSAIRNVWTEGHEAFGRIGNETYLAAVEWMIPGHIDATDGQAIMSYMDSISHFFRFDESGNKIGMDIINFINDAVEEGLGTINNDEFVINPNVSMQDFADKLDLPLGLVRAFFDEMKDFGGEFSWLDESIKTFGDLAVHAHDSLDLLDGLVVKLDFSDIEDETMRLTRLNAEIEGMENYIAQQIEIGADASQIEAARDVLVYLVAQRQRLENPAIMSIDTSQLDESQGKLIELAQTYLSLLDERELAIAAEMDTSNLDAQIADVESQLADNKTGFKVNLELELDTDDIPSFEAQLRAIDDVVVELGIDPSAVLEYDPNDLSASVVFTPEHSEVDAFMRRDFTIRSRVYHTHVETNSPPRGGKSGDSPQVNGNANLQGTAHANGNWGTKRTEQALVGELGQELVVVGNRWYTVGDSGAEFANIPKGAIIFNHKQTEEIFRNGFVTSGGGRGKSYAFGNAHAQGTAYVTGSMNLANAARSSSSFSSTVSQSQQTISSANSASRAVQSAQQASGDALKALADYFDFIEIRLNRLARLTRRAERRIQNANSLAQAQSRTATTMNRVQNEMRAARQAYNRYMRHAQDYARQSGLSTTLQNQVRNGTIDIRSLSEDERTKVQEFQKWYEKAQGALDLIDDLKEKERELAKQRLQNIVDFNNAIKGVKDSIIALNESRLELSTALGKSAIGGDVIELIQSSLRQQESIFDQSLQKLTDYQNEFNNLVRQGYIREGSLAYHEGRQKINELTTASNEAAVALIELSDRLRRIEFERIQQLIDGFARGIERLRNGQSLAEARDEFVGRDVLQQQIDKISQSIGANQELRNAKLAEQSLYDVTSVRYQELAKEIAQIDSSIYGSLIEIERIRDQIFAAEFFHFDKQVREMNDFISEIDAFRRLLNSDAFFDRSGAITDSGLANILLIGQGMEVAKQQIATYTEGIRKLDQMLQNGLISTTEYEERQREFLNAIRDSVHTVDNYRNELLNLYKTQMQNENRALQDNIRLRRDALRNMRDYHDFANRVRVQTRDVNALRAQAAALQGVNNASAAAELRRIQAQLRDAEETLENTQRDREFEIKMRGLDRMASDLDDALEDMMYSITHSVERQEQVIADMLNNVVKMYSQAFGKISNIISDTGIIGSGNFNNTVSNSGTQSGTQNIVSGAIRPQDQVRPADIVNDINTSNTNNSNHASVEKELAQAPNVTNRLVAEFKLSTTSLTVQEGGSVALPSANIRPTDAANKTIQWTSSNNKVAEISGGSVRGLSPGSTSLTASTTDGSGISVMCSISVTPRPTPTPTPPVTSTPGSGSGQSNNQPRVGQQVTFANGKYFHTSAGGHPWGTWNLGGRVFVTRISPNASHPFHISMGSRLGDRDLGWLRLNQLSGFRKGGVTKDELAFFDEDGLGSEVMITPGGALMQMQAGTNVFNKAQTAALHELADKQVTASNLAHRPSTPLNLSRQNNAIINISYDNLLNVEGNVDKDALPSLKEILDESYRHTSRMLSREVRKLR